MHRKMFGKSPTNIFRDTFLPSPHLSPAFMRRLRKLTVHLFWAEQISGNSNIRQLQQNKTFGTLFLRSHEWTESASPVWLKILIGRS